MAFRMSWALLVMIWRALYLAAPPFPTKLSVYIESHKLCCYIAVEFPTAQRVISTAQRLNRSPNAITRLSEKEYMRVWP